MGKKFGQMATLREKRERFPNYVSSISLNLKCRPYLGFGNSANPCATEHTQFSTDLIFVCGQRPTDLVIT